MLGFDQGIEGKDPDQIRLFGLVEIASFIFMVAGAVYLVYADIPAPIHTLAFDSGRNSYEVGSFLKILEDETGQWTIDDVTAEPLAHEFVPAKTGTLNLGLSESAFWFHFSANSRTPSSDFNR